VYSEDSDAARRQLFLLRACPKSRQRNYISAKDRILPLKFTICGALIQALRAQRTMLARLLLLLRRLDSAKPFSTRGRARAVGRIRTPGSEVGFRLEPAGNCFRCGVASGHESYSDGRSSLAASLATGRGRISVRVKEFVWSARVFSRRLWLQRRHIQSSLRSIREREGLARDRS